MGKKEAMLHVNGSVSETIRLFKSQEFRDGYIEKKMMYNSVIHIEMLNKLNGLKFLKYSDYVKAIQHIYKHLGSNFMIIGGYLTFSNIDLDEFESLYNNYVSQGLSYLSNPKFTYRILSKIMNCLLHKLYFEIHENCDGLNMEGISSKLWLGMFMNLDSDTYIEENIEKMGNKCENKVAVTKDRNIGNSEQDWIGHEISIEGVYIKSNRDMNILSNETLERLFLTLYNGDKYKFKRQYFLYTEYNKLKESKKMKSVLLRHIVIWLVKTMIFSDSLNGNDNLKDYEFYWNHEDLLQPALDMYNEMNNINGNYQENQKKIETPLLEVEEMKKIDDIFINGDGVIHEKREGLESVIDSDKTDEVISSIFDEELIIKDGVVTA